MAIKFLTRELTPDPAAAGRFIRERQLLTSVRSPHLIRVHGGPGGRG